MTPAVNSLVIPLLTSPKFARIPGMRFASVKSSQLSPFARTVATAGGRGVIPWGAEPICSDHLDPPMLSTLPSAVAPLDVRLMGRSGRPQNEAVHPWSPHRVSTADVRSSTEWSPTAWNDSCPSIPSEFDETGDEQSRTNVQHQHYHDNDSYRVYTPRHPAFDAMETKSNYRRLRTAGGVADFGDPWKHADADAMLGRPTTTEQLTGGDSTTSIGSSSTLQTLTSYSDRRSRVSRISSRSIAASTAARLGLATSRESRRSQEVLVSSRRLGTSGSVIPLNSKGELRQELVPTLWPKLSTGNRIGPVSTGGGSLELRPQTLVAPPPPYSPCPPAGAARGGKYRERLRIAGPSRGFRVVGLHM
jgi:hypothetical protein